MTTSLSTATEATAPSGFAALNLSEPVLKAIEEVGYTEPTPVQAATYPIAISGRDIIVQARTGTGKTAAFGIPLVDKLVTADPWVQALVLAPTRELAVQSQRELARLAQYKGLHTVAIYGGAPMGRQIDELKSGAQLVSGTPGRVLDHLRRGTLDPARLKVLVLDEMDEMLSMGFAKELNAILEMIPPKGKRQTMCFSATVDGEIRRHAERHMHEPEMISLSSDAVSAAQITHQVYMVSGRDRIGDLVRVLEVEDPDSAIVFCNMRSETERVAMGLKQAGFNADWLNGDLPQKDRERIMASTREGKLRYLVATDVAARGIDISHLTHVINFTFPESAAVYVHRTGRTGRAGRTGCAISLVGPEELGRLYYLRLEYKISPNERSLPSHGELKTRQEIDRIGLLEAAFKARPNPNDLSVARRLLTHPENELILAGLLHTFFGTKDDVDEEAAAARRSKPGPEIEQERPTRDSERPARDRGREREQDRPRSRDRDAGRGPDRDREPARGRDRDAGRGPVRDREPVRARDAAQGSERDVDARPRDASAERNRDRNRSGRDAPRSRERADERDGANARDQSSERDNGAAAAERETARGRDRENVNERERDSGSSHDVARSDDARPRERSSERDSASRSADRNAPRDAGRGRERDRSRERDSAPRDARRTRDAEPSAEREAGSVEREDDQRASADRSTAEGSRTRSQRERAPESSSDGERARTRERSRPRVQSESVAPNTEASSSADNRDASVKSEDANGEAQENGTASTGRRRRSRSRDRGRARPDDASQPRAADTGSESDSAAGAEQPVARGRSRSSAQATPLVAVDGELMPAEANGADADGELASTQQLEGLLYLNLGKRDGLGIPDVARLLRDSCELSRGQIGRIRVRDRYTFVDVPEERLDSIIATLSGQVVHDKPLAPERAKTAKS